MPDPTSRPMAVPPSDVVLGRRNCWTCQHAVIETTSDGRVKAWACKAFMHFHTGITDDISHWLWSRGSESPHETPCHPTPTKCPSWETA